MNGEQRRGQYTAQELAQERGQRLGILFNKNDLLLLIESKSDHEMK